MPGASRLSHQGLTVLRVFLASFSDNVRAELAGADVMKAVGISSGTLYPILLRLERSGVLESRWEETSPGDLGRPRRRFYRLTSQGAQFAHDALHELMPPLFDQRAREA
jgi:DNA-binding PadR family transcriptional regulator